MKSFINPALLLTLISTLGGCAIIINPNDGDMSFRKNQIIQPDGQASKDNREVGNTKGMNIKNSKGADINGN